jgi:hypothetical protein
MATRNFEEEREQARQVADRLTSILQAHGYEVGHIDYERAGRLAYVPVNTIEVGDLYSLDRDQPAEILRDVRIALLEAAAQKHLQSQERGTSWTPLEIPADAASEVQSLWRIHLGEEERPGVNIAEILRDGRRTYEYYPGGAQFGVHQFYVDKITPKALQIIRELGGKVLYSPEAQRADDVKGRRQVTLPEGVHQYGESDENMAPQRFQLPGGVELRLVPHWWTVDLSVVGE